MTGRPAPVRGALRLVRGAVLAVASGTLSVAAHAVGGGMLPDFGLTALLTVGVAAVGTALADKRRGPGVILLTLAVAQVGTHVLLSVAGDPGAMAPMPPVDPLAMLAAHAVAVVLTALLLAGADAVIFRVAAALARLLPRPLAGPPATGSLPAPRFADPVDRALAVLLRLASPRRGPPVTA